MSISETDRLHLYETARTQWDDDAARTLMNLLPPDAARLATKEDLVSATAVLRAEMSDLRGDLRSEMSDMRGELRAEMSDLRGDLRAAMSGLRGELKTEMADLRADTARGFAEHTRTLLLANVAMWLSIAGLVVGLRFT